MLKVAIEKNAGDGGRFSVFLIPLSWVGVA